MCRWVGTGAPSHGPHGPPSRPAEVQNQSMDEMTAGRANRVQSFGHGTCYPKFAKPDQTNHTTAPPSDWNFKPADNNARAFHGPSGLCMTRTCS